MRQQTPASRVTPFSFNYQGEHPAGLWLTHALHRRCFHLSPPTISQSCASVFYPLDQSWLKDFAEPTVRFPIEWREQALTGLVHYARNDARVHLLDAFPVAVECLDIARLRAHVRKAFFGYVPPEVPLSEETQILSLVWEWKEADIHGGTQRQRWSVSGELPGGLAAYGVLQSYCSTDLLLYYCYRPETQTTAFTADICAEDPVQAVKCLLQEEAFTAAVAKSSLIDALWLQQNMTSASPTWPEMSWDGQTIKIVSQRPDLRPASLKIEGYCWGLMAHLLGYLNTRYSSCDAVFQRLQHFDQKMRGALSPFA